MKRVLNALLTVLLFIWQLPQNIVGACVLIALWDKIISISKVSGASVIYAPCLSQRYSNAFSLGNLIFTGEVPQTQSGATIVKHEYGHCKQSVVLGPLYLPLIGVFSGVHALWWRPGRGNYHAFWTERWADKWGGVQR